MLIALIAAFTGKRMSKHNSVNRELLYHCFFFFFYSTRMSAKMATGGDTHGALRRTNVTE